MGFDLRQAPLGAVLMGAAMLTALPLHAQESGSSTKEEAMELAPLVVEGERERADGPVDGPFATQSATATKTDTPIIETPQSISVISSQDMSARGARSLAQSIRYATGITTENRGGAVGRYDLFSIRGFSTSQTYLDGMLMPYNGWYSSPQIAPEMVERLEILKGPASVLYGSAPPGGLVNSVSKRPQDTASGEISASIGSDNLYEGLLDATGPLDQEGKFSYRFIGLGRVQDGQARTTETERRLIAPSFRWQPTDKTSLTLLTHFQHDPKGGTFGGVPGAGSVFPNPNGPLPTDFYDGDEKFEEFNRKQLTLGYIFEHRFDDVFTFTQNTRYLKTDLDYESVYGGLLLPDNRTLLRAMIYTNEESTSYSTDNRLQAKFNTGAISHTLLAGVDYWTLDSDLERGDLVPTLLTPFIVPPIDIYNPDNNQPLPAVPLTQLNNYEIEQTGIYLQEQLKLDGLVVLLGGRQDWYESKNTIRLTPANNSSISQDKFSGRAGVLYHFENGLAPYISYAESFEPQTGADRFGNAFEPTTGQQVEAGLKFQSPDGSFLITGSVFDLTKQNVTVSDPLGAPGDQIQQGEVRSRGFELEGHIQPLSGLNIAAFYTKMDVETTEDTNAANIGKTPVQVAEETASLWAEYALPSSLIDGLTIGGGVRYVGETYVDVTNTLGTTDPYTLFDAMIEYDLGAISPQLGGNSLRLNGTNLADKRHVAGCYTQLMTGCWFGAERQVTLTFTHRW